jgi:hypothetical protein
MAKVIWKQASKDDPIYTGRFIISSHNKRPPVKSDKGNNQDVTAEKKEKRKK